MITIIDTDPLFDCIDLEANVGDACDDGDDNTDNDRISDDCECVGNQIFDCANLLANIGDTCDDGDDTTIDDFVTADCECVGTALPNVSISDVEVNEEDGLATLDICIDATFDNIVTVRYTTADETAFVGEDYRMIDGVATICLLYTSDAADE